MSDCYNSAVMDFEISLIRSDANFYLEFIPQFVKQESAAILIFGLSPYISLFTVESYSYLQSSFPNYAQEIILKHEQIIRSSRMRMKFLDDTNNRVNGVFGLLDEISQFYEDWFINSHTGYLSSLKRYLQPDMGIFAFDGHIIGSTHTGFFFTGLGQENLTQNGQETEEIIGKLLFSINQEIGAYLASINTYPEFIPVKTNSFVYPIKDDKLGYKDVKSIEFFSSVFNKNSNTSINFSLLLFLSTINFFRYILSRILGQSPDILFKLKFITLYHLASSLQKLQDYCYTKNLLTEESKEYFKLILKDKELKKIKQKELRNILVHYKLEKIPNSLIYSGFNLQNLVEYFFAGSSFDEIDQKINNQITRISDILEQWLNWPVNSYQFSQW